MDLFAAHQEETLGFAEPDPSVATCPGGVDGEEEEGEEAREKGELRVMTYNVWNADDGPHWKPLRLGAILERVRADDPDVVSFQEVRRGGELDMFRDLCVALRGQYTGVFAAAEQVSQGKTEGLALFFKKRDLEWSGVSSKRLAFKDARGRSPDENHRIALGARVRPRGARDWIWVVSAHFSFEKSQRWANAMSFALISRIWSQSAELVVLGDWNSYVMNHEDLPLALVALVARVRDAYDGEGKLEPSFCNCKGGLPPMKCELDRRPDRIMSTLPKAGSPRTQTGELNGVCPSDHAPVTASFRIAH